MSSVIIKGMDMPSSCSSCRFKWNGDSTCYCTAQVGDERHRNIHVIKGSESDIGNKREDGCPRVQIPKNHGRLIDADNANEVMAFEMSGTGYQARACSIVKSDLYTPTILDAEGEE